MRTRTVEEASDVGTGVEEAGEVSRRPSPEELVPWRPALEQFVARRLAIEELVAWGLRSEFSLKFRRMAGRSLGSWRPVAVLGFEAGRPAAEQSFLVSRPAAEQSLVYGGVDDAEAEPSDSVACCGTDPCAEAKEPFVCCLFDSLLPGLLMKHGLVLSLASITKLRFFLNKIRKNGNLCTQCFGFSKWQGNA